MRHDRYSAHGGERVSGDLWDGRHRDPHQQACTAKRPAGCSL